jgi:hypothetical protein
MREDPSNPTRNCIPQSIDEAGLVQAIETSGYPLQGIVASKLKSQFQVTEEWGYIDQDSEEHRSLDVLAYRRLQSDKGDSIQPGLQLLIECKRSIHPFVFFKTVTDWSNPQFPSIVGIPNGLVSIEEKARKKSAHVPGFFALGIKELDFIASGPPKCAAFSKAIPSGKKVELSGTDPFNSIMLPLVKSLRHAIQLHKVAQRGNLSPTLILCVSVLDAPMLLVESPEQASDPILTPWLRVFRQEANTDPKSLTLFRFYAVDVVHIDAFDKVVQEHLIPFAEEFGRRVIHLGKILTDGEEVPNFDDWQWDQIRPKT